MATGDFVWCDLSTFRPDQTRDFYRQVFGWQYAEIRQPDGSPYWIASAGRRETAGLFQMPQKFQELGLPSFWMSYVEVADADKAVAIARARGGKVEMGPTPFQDGSRIALIRDPLGAGFTIIENAGLPIRSSSPASGGMAWNALYVSDAAAVTAFYEGVFGWQFAETPWAMPGCRTFRIEAEDGRHVSDLHQVDEAVRGAYEYWAVHFAVPDVADAEARIRSGGGQILFEDGSGVLVQDPDGAAFFIS